MDAIGKGKGKGKGKAGKGKGKHQYNNYGGSWNSGSQFGGKTKGGKNNWGYKGGTGPSNNPTRACHNCSGTDHLIADCPNGDMRECYNCGGKGHIGKNCPSRKGQTSGKGGTTGGNGW